MRYHLSATRAVGMNAFFAVVARTALMIVIVVVLGQKGHLCAPPHHEAWSGPQHCWMQRRAWLWAKQAAVLEASEVEVYNSSGNSSHSAGIKDVAA